jgi:hypothetical protein
MTRSTWAALALAALLSAVAVSAQTVDPLVQILVSKGVLTPEEARSIAPAAPAERIRLAALLRDKGVLTAAEYEAASGVKPAAPPAPALAPAPAPAVVAAVAPLRVLPIDPPTRGGLIPDIRLGSGVRIKPYGMVKASLIYDSSSPYGNDMPLPGFLGDSGPDASPEFHAKARFFRVGSNFEWPDLSPKWTLTGRFEADFEGNFSRVNNRSVSTIRSNAFQLRLAWARLDRQITDKTSVNFLAGQDWTPFGSSTLPTMEESTGIGLGYGFLYERLPQFRVGLVHKVGGPRQFKISPEIALSMPAFGNVPSNVGDQLGYGERQGADSARPEVQGRIVAQFQLDRAPGVAPAQFIASFVHASRSAVVPAANVPTDFRAAFPNGARVSSLRYGYSLEMQLPTRAFTLLGKYFNGEDLRFYLVGNLLSNFNDVGGLAGVSTVPSIDGSSNVSFGYRNGAPAVAPQRPIRTQGGFVNLGLPISRWFGANPSGRNAGWAAYMHYSYDYALARDVRRCGAGRSKSDLAAVTLQYKFNSFVSFLYEQSMYRTRAPNHSASDAGGLPLFRGIPSYQWHDNRSELGTMFTF